VLLLLVCVVVGGRVTRHRCHEIGQPKDDQKHCESDRAANDRHVRPPDVGTAYHNILFYVYEAIAVKVRRREMYRPSADTIRLENVRQQ